MRKDIHPKEYRFVIFKDMSNEFTFITKSTVNTRDSIVWEDGKEYPLVKLEISNTSDRKSTGKIKLIDTAGRVDKFKTKYQKHFENRNKAE
jgi:ribosomal protein L31